MTPSDWAAWVQAIGSVAAIGVAIWIPWRIHTSEQTAAQNARLAYRSILKDALVDLQEPLAMLKMFGTQPLEDREEETAGVPVQRWTRQDREQAVEVASDMGAALTAMTQAANILDELKAIDGIDSYDVIRALFHLRRKLREYLPLMSREAELLDDYPTPQVVLIAIQKLRDPTTDLLESVGLSLDALNNGRQQER